MIHGRGRPAGSHVDPLVGRVWSRLVASSSIASHHSGLLLGSSFGLGCLLLVAVDHHNSYESAHHSGAQQGQNHGDADGPDTRREEVVEWVAGVNKGLYEISAGNTMSKTWDRPSVVSRLYSTER